MRWLKIQSKVLVGIDFGARYIKFIELERNSVSPIIRHYFIIKLPTNILTAKNEINEELQGDLTIPQLFSTIKTDSQRAVIGIPGSAVVTKEIVLSKGLSDSEMETQAWLEASKHFPNMIEDLSLDFHVNGTTATDENTLDVLLVACRKTTIQKFIEVLQNSPFQIEVVDVDFYAFERALNYMTLQLPDFDLTHTYALLNLGSTASTFVALRNGRLLYAKDEVFEGQMLMAQVEQVLELKDILLQPTQIASQLDLATIAPLTEVIANHVRHVLELFYSSVHVHDAIIKKLYLSGEGALISHLAELISNQMDIDVVIANPIINMELGSSVNDENIKIIAPALTLCCGLALHEGKS